MRVQLPHFGTNKLKTCFVPKPTSLFETKSNMCARYYY
jgi:hypothetical protein